MANYITGSSITLYEERDGGKRGNLVPNHEHGEGAALGRLGHPQRPRKQGHGVDIRVP